MRYQYCTADVFTDRPFGGNALAVLIDATGLDADLMQVVAKEFNYSETAFVLPPEDASSTRKLRIFTPFQELPFAGHPTIGTAIVLAAIGELSPRGELLEIVFEEGVGKVPVAVRFRDGEPTYAELSTAQLPQRHAAPRVEEVAPMLGLTADQFIGPPFEPEVVSCGVPFLLAPLDSLEGVRKIRFRAEMAEETLAELHASGVYAFCFRPGSDSADIQARMFAPGLGVPEDPATGAAAAALAGYLAARQAETSGACSWTLNQGFEMGRPSMIRLSAAWQGGRIVSIRVGGASVLICRGEIEIPS